MIHHLRLITARYLLAPASKSKWVACRWGSSSKNLMPILRNVNVWRQSQHLMLTVSPARIFMKPFCKLGTLMRPFTSSSFNLAPWPVSVVRQKSSWGASGLRSRQLGKPTSKFAWWHGTCLEIHDELKKALVLPRPIPSYSAYHFTISIYLIWLLKIIHTIWHYTTYYNTYCTHIYIYTVLKFYILNLLSITQRYPPSTLRQRLQGLQGLREPIVDVRPQIFVRPVLGLEAAPR